MKFAVAHYPLYETKTTRLIGVMLAAILLVITLAQLFGFEEFYVTLANFWNISRDTGATLATLIVVAEVFSLPFLLGMKISTGMRLLGAFLLLAVTAYWAAAILRAAYSYGSLDTGLLGSVVSVEGTIPSLLFATLLLVGVTIYFAHVYIDSHQLHQHLRKSLK